jgi:serine/threonine protein kinase
MDGGPETLRAHPPAGGDGDSSTLVPGRSLSHFRILAPIGEGGMGVVYRAEDLNLRRVVALKVLAPHALGDERR